MSYSAYYKCVVCDKNLSQTNNSAYFLCNANKIDKENNLKVNCTFDSSGKFLICKDCMHDLILNKKYSKLSIPESIKSFLKLHLSRNKFGLGVDSNYILTSSSTQEDVNDIVIKISKNLLKNKGE